MTQVNRELWDLFDQAENGELQLAHERRWGVNVNPHYLPANVKNTRVIAGAMLLLPWFKEISAQKEKITYQDYMDYRSAQTDIDGQNPIPFDASINTLVDTGLASKRDNNSPEKLDFSNIEYRITKRGINAHQREVIFPANQIGCISCLGTLAISSLCAVGTLYIPEFSDSDMTGKVMFSAGTLLGVTGLLGEATGTLKAAQAFRHYNTSDIYN